MQERVNYHLSCLAFFIFNTRNETSAEENTMAAKNYLFTSESVTEGHPDKLADQISDAVLDALLEKDPLARVACETSVTTGLVVKIGETSSTAQINAVRVARDTIADVGYTSADLGLDAEHRAVLVSLDQQSADIAQGVNTALEH